MQLTKALKQSRSLRRNHVQNPEARSRWDKVARQVAVISRLRLPPGDEEEPLLNVADGEEGQGRNCPACNGHESAQHQAPTIHPLLGLLRQAKAKEAAAAASSEGVSASGCRSEPPSRPPPSDGGSDPYDEDREEHKKGIWGDMQAVRGLFTSSWLNVLLLCAPLGIASEYLDWGPVATFCLNFFALIPLALILGDVTEDMAKRFGSTIGGLINATFGNVVELILSITALQKGLYTVVSTSLMGSILSNLLLVLGCCFLFGGMRYQTQSFNELGNRACSSLLFLSSIGIIIPSAASRLINTEEEHPNENWVLNLSRGSAIILLACYICYLVFQLKTHHELFEDDGEEDEPELSMPTALLLLTFITIVVAFCSEFLTGSIERVSEDTGLGQAFLGMIVLPIAGNACEHITAVIVATKNKMDLSLGVAVGSSIQIALFAIPFTVLVGWATGHEFSLSFDSFSALALALSVIHANVITSDATSHWLMGVELIAVYLLIALTYLYR